MRTLILYTSVHHRNTERVAQTMADMIRADLMEGSRATADTLREYDLIGFGSGIYFGKHHKSLLDFVDSLPMQENKLAFIFSTSGRGGVRSHDALRKSLMEKGFRIAGQFATKGLDTYSILKLVGGINKGRPNKQDLEDAARFAEALSHSAEEELGKGTGPELGTRTI
jgi:flavodoxin